MTEVYESIFERVAREDGMVQGKLDVARSMKNDGMPIEKIQKYTGLPVTEIQSLMN